MDALRYLRLFCVEAGESGGLWNRQFPSFLPSFQSLARADGSTVAHMDQIQAAFSRSVQHDDHAAGASGVERVRGRYVVDGVFVKWECDDGWEGLDGGYGGGSGEVLGRK